MRIFEIICGTRDVQEQTIDSWETRFAATRRQQTKRVKARAKLDTAQARAYQQHRHAADQQAASNDKLRSAQKALADANKPEPAE